MAITKTSGTAGMQDSKVNTKDISKNKVNNEHNAGQKPSKMHKTMSLILCLSIIVVAAIGLFVPLIFSSQFSLTPLNLMSSWDIVDLKMGSVPELYISYYLYKYFFFGYAGVLAGAAFFFMMLLITRSDKIHKQTNIVMYVVLLFLLLLMLIGFNYVNVIDAVKSNTSVTTPSFLFFGIGLILMLIKMFVDIVCGKKTLPDDLKESSLAIYTSFTQSFLTLLAIFFPLYIFPGTKYRMRGIDIILGKEDVFSFMPMAVAYKVILLGFTAIVGISLILNMFFFVVNRKLFVRFNRFNHLFSLFAIFIYAFMGINYMLCYIDAGGYNVLFNTSMNTYSFIPLALLLLFWIGCGFTKLAASRLSVNYKIYATPDDVAVSKGTKSDDGIPDPIPAFSELDKKIEQFAQDYQKRQENAYTGVTLPGLVEHIIEYAKYSKERLSYGPVEVKTFIAGLAASRLSILQGMSGTGKTSLPKIFMEAIDGVCEIVAIESSWRDKNELLGYYNEFNKKYTPKSFTQFLYKASLNKEIPYFIVLDEMNLSRIEYYFSDFLSLMEARENLRHIKLFDVQLFPHIDEREQYLALRDGHTIDIPTNVWFIGTANRDESTFEISDKVYDRAQTMNFDKRAPKVVVDNDIDYPKRFVTYTELRKLFDESKSIGFDAEKFEVIHKVEKILSPYKISFGNRVLKQIEEFVNAYIACNEILSDGDRLKYAHEAVDCILFSKVVRKLELKQITDIESLIEDFESLKLTKCIEFLYTLKETT